MQVIKLGLCLCYVASLSGHLVCSLETYCFKNAFALLYGTKCNNRSV